MQKKNFYKHFRQFYKICKPEKHTLSSADDNDYCFQPYTINTIKRASNIAIYTLVLQLLSKLLKLTTLLSLVLQNRSNICRTFYYCDTN